MYRTEMRVKEIDRDRQRQRQRESESGDVSLLTFKKKIHSKNILQSQTETTIKINSSLQN